MARIPRREIIDEQAVGVYHCVQRCVRRAFLCGKDPVTGRDYEHRKGWIRSRLQFLAGQFAIDILDYSIMSNHVHVVVRNRPDIVRSWSDDEVARRWWNLFPKRKDKSGQAAEPLEHELAMLISNAEALAEKRRRLSSISWLMRCLAERIARQANKEDGCTGRFWEGRYKCQRLLDNASVLACSVYVDLNPIRAGVATMPENSRFTSAYDRIHSKDMKGNSAKARDAWLSPVEADSRLDDLNPQRAGCRASNRGFLDMKLDEYLGLLDWTCRQAQSDQQTDVPVDLQPLLVRSHVSAEMWTETVLNFGRWFHRAAGRQANLSHEAARHGRRWLAGIRHSRKAFV
jgi:hypothetical protein